MSTTRPVKGWTQSPPIIGPSARLAPRCNAHHPHGSAAHHPCCNAHHADYNAHQHTVRAASSRVSAGSCSSRAGGIKCSSHFLLCEGAPTLVYPLWFEQTMYSEVSTLDAWLHPHFHATDFGADCMIAADRLICMQNIGRLTNVFSRFRPSYGSVIQNQFAP